MVEVTSGSAPISVPLVGSSSTEPSARTSSGGGCPALVTRSRTRQPARRTEASKRVAKRVGPESSSV